MIVEYTLLIPNFHFVGEYIGLIAAFIPVFGIFFGIKEKKEKTNFGYISFKEGFKTGIAITFIIAVFIVIFTYVYYEYINPDFVDQVSNEREKTMINNNVNREIINDELAIIEYQYSFNMQIIQQLLFIILGGTAITIVISLILKKARKHSH
jgi:hypothetical protein